MNAITQAYDKAYDKATDIGAQAMVAATNGLGKLATTKHGKVMFALPLALSVVGTGTTVFANSTPTVDSVLGTIYPLLKAGVIALGGLIAIIGGIQIGVGFQNENPEGKSRGMQTLIGGGIIAGVAAIIPGGSGGTTATTSMMFIHSIIG